MNTDEKLELVVQESDALMAYFEERNLSPNIGLSVLVSSLMTTTKALDIPIEVVVEALQAGRAALDDSLSSEGKSLH